MTTLLDLCTEACDEIGIKAPTAIVGSTAATARRLLRLANRGGRRLMKRHNWTVLQREHTFTLTAADDEYDLPTDFDRFIDGTLWDRDVYMRLRGPMSAIDWQRAKSGLVTSAGLRPGFRVKRASSGNVRSFFVEPVPTATDDLVFEYISKNWCAKAADGTGQNVWTLDTDVPILDADLLRMDLIWRAAHRLGLSYDEERDEFEDAVSTEWARDGGMPVLSITSAPVGLPTPNIPDTGFGS